MVGKIQPYECKWPMICSPWATIFIYFSLFFIWKAKLETRYITVKLVTSFWIRIYVFGKMWLYIWFVLSTSIVLYNSIFHICTFTSVFLGTRYDWFDLIPSNVYYLVVLIELEIFFVYLLGPNIKKYFILLYVHV